MTGGQPHENQIHTFPLSWSWWQFLLFSGVALASTGQSESSTPTDGEVEELKDELMEAIFDGDGTSAWESMTPEEQTLVVEAIKESFIAVFLDGDDALADGSSGCDAHTGRKRVVMTDDVWLWEYFSETHWCWDGTQITNDPNVARRGYEYQSFVKFVGHTNTSENGGEGDLSHYDYSRGAVSKSA